MESLLSAVMGACDMNESEANALIEEMKEQVNDGEDPEELLYEIGLEPDYVLDLIGY